MLKALAFIIFVAFLLLVPVSSRADGVNVVDEYNVSGVLTITGANACAPAPACAETMSFSFLMGSITGSSSDAYGLTYTSYVVPGSGTFESLGPLGQFSSIGEPASVFPSEDCGAEGDCNYIGIFDQSGDEIDLHLAETVSDTPIVPDIVAVDLFSCGAQDTTCAQDFPPAMFVFGNVDPTATSIATPEPSSLLLLTMGFFTTCLLWFRSKNRAQTEPNRR